MRRGLLSWDKEEAPVVALEARVARCQSAISDAGLGCLVVYTNFPRPSAVSWLTHFVPYWSQAVLLVFLDGMPMLVASLTPRVGPWIASVSHLGDITHTPDTGGGAARLIADRCSDGARVGVVELNGLPGGIAIPLAAGIGNSRLEDAGALFADLCDPADEVEIALSARAAEIASAALEAGIAASADGSGAGQFSDRKHGAPRRRGGRSDSSRPRFGRVQPIRANRGRSRARRTFRGPGLGCL